MEDIFNTQSELQEELTDTPEIVDEEIDDLPADDAVLPADESSESEESAEDTEESSENEIVSEQKEQKPKEDKLSAYEKAVLAEMERRSEQGDTLVANALKSADKNIHECWQYITAQAKKKAVAGCAMIEDAVVFGWAHHYYIEPKAVIDAELHPKPKDKPNTPATTTKPTKPTKVERPKETLENTHVPMIRPKDEKEAKRESKKPLQRQ